MKRFVIPNPPQAEEDSYFLYSFENLMIWKFENAQIRQFDNVAIRQLVN